MDDAVGAGVGRRRAQLNDVGCLPSWLRVGFGFTLALVVLTRWLWRVGLRNYSGASA